MSKSTTTYVGLDVHKDSVDIATCGAARAAKPEHLGSVGGGLEPVTKALRRLVSRGLRLHIVYEAGPCGFVLQRHWRQQNFSSAPLAARPCFICIIDSGRARNAFSSATSCFIFSICLDRFCALSPGFPGSASLKSA